VFGSVEGALFQLLPICSLVIADVLGKRCREPDGQIEAGCTDPLLDITEW